MVEREAFSFNMQDLGITSTNELGQDEVDNFLNADPNQVQVAPKKAVPKVVKKEKEEDEDEEEEITPAKKKPEVKEVAISNEISEDEAFELTNGSEKEEEEAEDEVETNVKPPVNQSSEDDSNQYEIIGKELLDRGILFADEDDDGNPLPLEIKTPEQLLEQFRISQKRGAADIIDKFLEKFGEDHKNMFNDVFVKGVSPQDYLSRYVKMTSYKELDLADEGNQERLVRELYRSEGRSPEYIEKRVTQLKNYSDLADEATEAQRLLIQKESAAIETAARAKEEEIARKTQIKNQYVSSVNKILTDKLKARDFDGIPVDKKTAEDTFAYITHDKFQTPDKQLLTEFDKDLLDLNRPENHELKVKMAMLLRMAKADPKLSKLTNRVISNESNELFKGLKKTGSSSTSTPKQAQNQVSSWFPGK